jgi:MFS transporter, DHA2 family, multidrug resistance protein
VPAEEAATASDTLGGAVEVADRLPELLAADVLEPAREAFTQGLQVAATVSGVLVVAAAVLVARLMRRGYESEERAGRPVAVAIEQSRA